MKSKLLITLDLTTDAAQPSVVVLRYQTTDDDKPLGKFGLLPNGEWVYIGSKQDIPADCRLPVIVEGQTISYDVFLVDNNGSPIDSDNPLPVSSYPQLLNSSGNVAEVKQAVISATSTDTTIVAAVADRKIRVVQVLLTVSADSAVRFESGTGGTALTGVMPIYANASNVVAVLSGSTGALCLPFSPGGWFETAVNTLLNLEKGTGNVFGVLGYIEY